MRGREIEYSKGIRYKFIRKQFKLFHFHLPSNQQTASSTSLEDNHKHNESKWKRHCNKNLNQSDMMKLDYQEKDFRNNNQFHRSWLLVMILILLL